MNTKLLIQGLALTLLLSNAQNSSAAITTFNLCAGVTTVTMPDATTVTMWGYGPEDFTANCDSATVPGPKLVVPPNDTLVVKLRNTLPEPSSIMIPGLSSSTPPQPVFYTDSQGRQRAKSMVHEAAANGGTATYTFNATAGTYLYQSGSHSAVQMQMGLYGAVTSESSPGVAYPGVSFNNEVVLLYSEIDPALHSAITNGTYGTTAYKTTIDYNPKYFLVNGQPYTSLTPDFSAGVTGEKTLIRFLNAGLKSHVPVIQNAFLDLIAEHGSPYPFTKKQYSLLLAPGQTKDVIFTPTTADRYALYDRRLRLTNNMQTQGGLISFLNVVVVGAPTANSDSAITDEDTAITALDLASNDTDDGVLDLTSLHIAFPPANGTVTINTGVNAGTVTYTPSPNFNGTDSFIYTIKDTLGNQSNQANVTIDVTAINDAPVAIDDTYTMDAGTTLSEAVPGILGNDTDIEQDTLTATLQTDVIGGSLLLNNDGSFSYTPTLGTTTDSFTYLVTDTSSANSNIATVTINVTPQSNTATLVSPSGSGSSSTPTYVWNSVLNSTWYYLWVNDSTGNVIKQWYTASAAGCANGEATCSVTPATALVNGNATFWVRTYFNGTGNGPWSSAMQFNVGSVPVAATLNQPAGIIVGNSPTYTWNTVTDATWYLLRVDDISGIAIQQWYTASAVGCANGEATCSITPVTTLADGDAKWWIRTYNAAGNGPWSTAKNFFIGGAPIATTLNVPSGNIVDSTPTYNWNAIPNSSWYLLSVNDSTGNVIQQWYTASAVGCANGEATCSITPSTTLNAGAGQWRVRTYNTAGNGPWSAFTSFNLQ